MSPNTIREETEEELASSIQRNVKDEKEELEELELLPDDLEAIALLYDTIRSVYRKVEKNVDKRLAEDFDTHLKNSMYELSAVLGEEQRPHLKNSAILKAKHSLMHICMQKAIEFVRKQNDKMGDILQQIAET